MTNNLTTIEMPPSRYQAGTVADLLPGWAITYDGLPYKGPVYFRGVLKSKFLSVSVEGVSRGWSGLLLVGSSSCLQG